MNIGDQEDLIDEEFIFGSGFQSESGSIPTGENVFTQSQ